MKTRAPAIAAACLLLLACLAALPARAEQNGSISTSQVWSGGGLSLGLGIEGRLRYETLNGFTIKRYDPAARDEVLLSRIRINAALTSHAGPGLFVQLQDARFWLSDLRDDTSPRSSYQNYLDLRQAYGQWLHMGGTPLGVRLGRQTVRYGDSHIFSESNWGNVGSFTWDIAKAMWQGDGWQVDAFGGQRVLYRKQAFDSEHYDYHVMAVYAQFAPQGPHGLDLFWVRKYRLDGGTEGESGPGDLDVNTVGFYFHGRAGGWRWRGTLALQGGDYGADRLRAWGGNLTASHTWDAALKPGVEASLSYASGDEDPGDGDNGTFQQVFGAVDRYYGLMNMFCWSNLVDYQVGLRLEPAKGLHLALDWHIMRLAQARDAWYYRNASVMRRDDSGDSGVDLGQELDLYLRWKQNQHLEWRSGVSRFFPGDFIAATGPAADATWAFVQITLTF